MSRAWPLVGALLLLLPPGAIAELPAEDAAYLRGVARDTWACIAFYVEPTTGLPYDTSARGEYTSVSNIGYYAASCAVAAEMGLVPRTEAVERVRRVLDAHEKLPKWKGFAQSWNHVKTLGPAPHDTMVSVLDSANMVAGFIVARQSFSEVADSIDAALGAMDFSAVYDPAQGLLFGGYDRARNRLDSGWHVGDYAGDGRMAAFWAIATGAAPPSSWDKLNRSTEAHYGLTIFRPAWMGGGLFMQAQDGLFLDERATPAGRSAADFAYVQMLYAADLGLSAWGWSACEAPDKRYLGWASLDVSVVTPHAVGLAAMSYPRKAAACLRRLEGMERRAPLEVDGALRQFGFRDSIDLRTGAVADSYLPPLDQAMFFLALANVLEDGIVQRRFESHPQVQKGRALLAEYRAPVQRSRLAELARRDQQPLAMPAGRSSPGPPTVAIADFERANIGKCLTGGTITTWTRDPEDASSSVAIARIAGKDGTPGYLQITYDMDSPQAAYGGVTFALQGADVSGCNSLRFRVHSAPDKLKVELHGAGGSGVTRLPAAEETEWRTVEIPLVEFGGMITDWRRMERLVFVFEDATSKPKQGVCLLDDIAFVRR